MTRETKIGLLVGLAFIIVIGILLSDHLTSSNEPPPAQLANAGNSVMQTINTPGSTIAAQAQPPAAPPQVQPNGTVPTAADLASRQPRVQIVQVGPGAQPQQQGPITIQSQDPQHHPDPNQQIVSPQPGQSAGTTGTVNPPGDTPVITYVPAPADGSLAQAAQRNGEALVAVDASGRPVENPAPATWTQALTGMQEYKAEPGDSVSKMAEKFYGKNTKSTRDLIIRANAPLQKDPNKVIVGQTYHIPSPAAASHASAPPRAAEIVADSPTQAPSAPPTVASATEYWYTVKENDRLWTIAEQQLGDGNAWVSIKELNKIQDENKIYPGMKLKLPGKPVASR